MRICTHKRIPAVSPRDACAVFFADGPCCSESHVTFQTALVVFSCFLSSFPPPPPCTICCRPFSLPPLGPSLANLRRHHHHHCHLHIAAVAINNARHCLRTRKRLNAAPVTAPLIHHIQASAWIWSCIQSGNYLAPQATAPGPDFRINAYSTCFSHGNCPRHLCRTPELQIQSQFLRNNTALLNFGTYFRHQTYLELQIN